MMSGASSVATGRSSGFRGSDVIGAVLTCGRARAHARGVNIPKRRAAGQPLETRKTKESALCNEVSRCDTPSMSVDPFSLTGRIAVVTGGYGVIGGSIATALGGVGAHVAILGRRRDVAEAKADEIRQCGGRASVVVGDVLDEAQMRAARDQVIAEHGHVDILFNGAGGNVARSRNDTKPIFDVPFDAFDEVLRLNLHGT